MTEVTFDLMGVNFGLWLMLFMLVPCSKNLPCLMSIDLIFFICGFNCCFGFWAFGTAWMILGF